MEKKLVAQINQCNIGLFDALAWACLRPCRRSLPVSCRKESSAMSKSGVSSFKIEGKLQPQPLRRACWTATAALLHALKIPKQLMLHAHSGFKTTQRCSRHVAKKNPNTSKPSNCVRHGMGRRERPGTRNRRAWSSCTTLRETHLWY